MATWINILDILYPIGSLYFSIIPTSPATLIGGTWTQIKGGMLAACGANGLAINAYGGSLAIDITQIPPHKHTLTGPPRIFDYNPDSGEIIAERVSTGARIDWTEYMGMTGGGQTFCLTTTEYISGSELLKRKRGQLWPLLV